MTSGQQATPMSARRGLAVLLGISLALAAASLTVVLAPQLFGSLHSEWRNYLDLLKEANLPAWWSSVLLLTTGVTHALVGSAARMARAPEAPSWFVSAGVLTVLSLDDHTQLHERSGRIGRALVSYDTFPFYWLVPGLVAGLAVAAALMLLAVRVPVLTRRLLVTGVLLLLGCALGLETVQGFLMAVGNHGTAFALVYHAEELGENLAALLLLAAATTAVSISRQDGDVDVQYACRKATSRHASYL